MEYIQTLDPIRLVLAGTALSFITAGFGDMTVNFPLYLGGYGFLLVGQQVEGADALQTLLILLASSTIFDIVHLTIHLNWFLRLLNVLQLILKVPTCLSLAVALRSKGNLGIRGSDLSGPTVWSMPGGFTSAGREGYQEVDDEAPAPAPKPAAPVSSSPSKQPPQGTLGGYQSV